MAALHRATSIIRNEGVFGLSKREKKAYDGIYNRYIKRILDCIISGEALLFIWPLYLIIGALIVAEDGFPVFYRAERGGYKGKTFRICKFRTMVKNADKIGGGTTALNDPRITKIGNTLRKTKLDEIPQLGQVFLGSMSVIGPRPELLKYTDRYSPELLEILEVRPGISDKSSVKFISLDEIVGTDNAEQMYEELVLDKKNALRLEYARTVSFRTDVCILFQTLAAVAKKAGRFFFKKDQK